MVDPGIRPRHWTLGDGIAVPRKAIESVKRDFLFDFDVDRVERVEVDFLNSLA